MRCDPVETGGLLDVSDLRLLDLDQIDESALAHAFRRLLENDGETGPIAGFNQSIGTPSDR